MRNPLQHVAWQRFWCPRDARYGTDADGFVRPPHEWAGSERWEPTASPRLLATPCLVLLGEPGIGKSYALTDMIDATRPGLAADEALLPIDLRDHRNIDSVLTHPEFQAWRADRASLCLFIDSLDERRHPDDASQLLGALKDGPRNRLRLRVACRTGELPHRYGDALGEWWGDPSAVEHRELLPLSREDVVAAARGADIDAEDFLTAVLRRDVVALATRPITLQFLIDQFRTHRGLAKHRTELYRSGCTYLCREFSITRRDHRQTGTLDERRRLAIARRIAAACVLAQKPILCPDPDPTALSDDAVEPRALADAPDAPSPITIEEITEVIAQTGLFTSRGEGIFGWSHLTYAEFLTAEFLRERIPDTAGLLRVLMPASLAGQVPLALRGVAAWLSSCDENLFAALLVSDVSVLLHTDLNEHSDAQRAALVTGLLERVAAGDLLDPEVPAALYARLAHPGLADQLYPWIENSAAYFIARRVAISIAEACVLNSLIPALLKLTLDEAEDYLIRREAIAALTAIAGPELRPSLRPLLASTVDPDDELRGYTLAFLRPELSVRDLLAHLVRPNNPSYIGKYYFFLNHEFVPGIADEDLPPVLDWLQSLTEKSLRRRGVDYFERTAAMIWRRAWAAMYHPSILSRLSRHVLERLRHSDDLFGGYSFPDLAPTPSILLRDPERRRAMVHALIHHDDFTRVAGFRLGGRSGLTRPDDLGWLVQEFGQASRTTIAERWTDLIADCVFEGGYSASDIEPVLGLANRHPPLRTRLAWLLDPEARAQFAERQRRNEAANEENVRMHRSFSEQEGTELSPGARLLHVITRAESGDWRAIASILSALRCDETRRPWIWKNSDPSQYPGWTAATPYTRDRILAVFHAYLAGDVLAARSWFHNPSRDAYSALRLLVTRDRTRLLRLPPDFWRRWVPTILSCAFGDESAEHGELLRYARRQAPEEFVWTLAFLTTQEILSGEVITARHLDAVWDNEIAELLLAKLRDPEVAGKGLTSLLTLLLSRRVTAARDFCEAALATVAVDPSRARASALALLIADVDYAWPALENSFTADPAFERAVLRGLSNESLFAMAGRCSESRIADVYCWIATCPVRESEHVDDLLTALRKQLTDRGTIAALASVRRLRDELPDDCELAIAHAMVRSALCARGWRPLSIRDVLALHPNPHPGDDAAALIDELHSLFRAPEHVRVFLRHSPQLGVAPHDLPFEGSTQSAASWLLDFVHQLHRRGVSVDELCACLGRSFSDHESTIARIRDLWPTLALNV